MKLLTTANTKILKSLDLGYMTFGIHLAPYTLAGVGNVCPWASEGCAAACLNTSGMGAFSNVQDSRIAKTQFFYAQRNLFMEQLVKEMRAAVRKAKREGYKPVFRLNLTSDIQWEKSHVAHDGKTVFEHFPDVQFMDYSKGAKRFGNVPPNYHLTFSRSEKNGDKAVALAKAGHNVAVVFDKVPKQWNGIPVIDGDEHDLRFLDPKGVIVGLKAKGKAKRDESGFVVKGAE